MKILIVTQYFWPENFRINDLAIALKERGHEVSVYTGLPNYPEGRIEKGYSFYNTLINSFSNTCNEEWNGIKIYRVPLIPRGHNSKLGLILNYLSFAFFATIFIPIKLKGKYDKVFIYQLSPFFSVIPAIFIKKTKNIKSIMWVQDLWPHTLKATGIVKNFIILKIVEKIVYYCYRNSDLIYVASSGYKKLIVNSDITESKIKYWPQWAEAIFSDDNILKINDNFNWPVGFKVMFAGNIGIAQDFSSILEAAKLLKNHTHIHFVILGNGQMKEWVSSEVKKNNLENQFHLLGRKPIEEMPYYYDKADVMLATLDDTELFSLTVPAKIQTYMIMKKPIISGINGETKKIINDAKCGIGVSSKSPIELANAIIEMSKKSQTEIEELGKNSFLYYQAEYERKKLLDILENDLRNI